MRSHAKYLILAFGVWLGGAGTHLQATESASADVYDYAGRFRLGKDGVLTFFVTCGELYVNSLKQGDFILEPIGSNSFQTPGKEMMITFHSTGLAEVVHNRGLPEQMAVRMLEGEKVPIEHIMEGNLDLAIAAYLHLQDQDLEHRRQRSLLIKQTADELFKQKQVEQSLILLNVLTAVYPGESAAFRGLGHVYLQLAIEHYQEAAVIDGEPDTSIPALEFILENK